MNEIEIASTLLKSFKISPNQAEKVGIKVKKDGQKRTAFDLLGQSHDNINKLINLFPDITRIKLKTLLQACTFLILHMFYIRGSNPPL